jgi:hypothetical protein
MKNDLLKYLIVLVAGIAIGAIFYPSKQISREVTEFHRSEISRIQEENSNKTKSLQEQINQSESNLKQHKEEYKQSISSLKTENRELRQKVTERTLKVVKPDGTIVTETFKESDTHAVTKVVTEVKEEFTRKVNQIEQNYKEIHTKRILQIKEQYESKIKEQESTISELKYKEKIKINEKRMSLAVGYTKDEDYYTSGTYDLFGPVFLDTVIKTTKELDSVDFGLGVGIRF